MNAVPSIVKILILAAFLNGLSWIVLIPIWQYPDEQSHFAQVQDIAELGNTPKIGANTSQEIAISEKLLDTQRDGLGNNKFTYHPDYHIEYTNTNTGIYEKFIAQLPIETRVTMAKWEATENPPLYHIMASNFYNLLGSSNLFSRIFAVRFFSLLLYITAVIISINASKLIFKDDVIAQTILPALIAFTPMFAFSATGVLPDPLTILTFTIIFTIGAKIIRDKLTIQLLILLIVMIALGKFTRQQFELAVPIAAIPVIYDLFKRMPKKAATWVVLVLILIVFLIIFWVTNHQLPINIPEIGSPNLQLLITTQFSKYLVSTLKHFYSQTLPWYWGVYKWLSLTVPHVYYQFINRIIALSLIGLAIWIFNVIKSRKFSKQDLIIGFFILSIFIYFITFIVWDFYFQRIFGYSFGIQGRYFLPLILPITSILLFGIKNLFRNFLKRYLYIVYFILIFAMVVFNDISLSFVASSYYDAVDLKTLISQVSQYKPFILKGNIIIAIVLLGLFFQVKYLSKLFGQIKINHESN